AKLVGKKVKARAVAIGDGIVWAELLSPVQAAEEPLTAEAEAERPTRARRPTAKKIEDQVETEVADAVVEPEPEEEAEEEAVADGALFGEASVPVKKKTRRGSRGGRNRKRKPAAAEAAEQVPGVEGDEQVPGTEPDEPPAADEAPVPAPIIHVPDRELTDDDAEPATPTKKRTRRGSRGGRNRRKKTATVGADGATATATADAELEPGPEPEPMPEPDREREPEPEPADPGTNGGWGYTPMSEWGLDDREREPLHWRALAGSRPRFLRYARGYHPSRWEGIP